MSPSVVQGRPFCGGLEWSKANFGRAGPGPRWDLAWRSANLEKFRLRRSFARGPAPSTPVLEESLDFEARRGKKEGFFYPHFIWSYVVQCWSYVASPTPSQMVQCASKCEIAALFRPGLRFGLPDHQTRGRSSTGLANIGLASAGLASAVLDPPRWSSKGFGWSSKKI